MSRKRVGREDITVFLGGTCEGSGWRDSLIPYLNVNYFNPVITGREWCEEDLEKEIKARKNCDICLYVITSMNSVFSFTEAVADAYKMPEKTIVAISIPIASSHQEKQINAVERLIMDAGATLVKDPSYINISKEVNKKAWK